MTSDVGCKQMRQIIKMLESDLALSILPVSTEPHDGQVESLGAGAQSSVKNPLFPLFYFLSVLELYSPKNSASNHYQLTKPLKQHVTPPPQQQQKQQQQKKQKNNWKLFHR